VTRDLHNAQYSRQNEPEDQVTSTGYNELCPACRLRYAHTWKRHDAAIRKRQKPTSEWAA
jgi:hypothetical protein